MPNWLLLLIQFLKSPRFKGIVAVLAAVVMYFSPDDIDLIIQGLLVLFGIPHLVITPVLDKKDGIPFVNPTNLNQLYGITSNKIEKNNDNDHD